MKTKSVASTWLERDGRRLDCGPYMSGAIEAREQFSKLRTEPLGALTIGPYGGVYRPPIFGMKFAQNTVDSLTHGVPFLTSSSMLDADLSSLPLISRRMAASPKYAVLRIAHGMSLVSCSGTVGKVVFTRRSMEGMWSSQAVMKIVPDPRKILAGYLNAFLRSRYGVPLIAGGTYGAIVPQIEREHLINLPVPRLGHRVEAKAHELVEEAGTQRDEAATLQRDAIARIHGLLGWRCRSSGNLTHATSSSLQRRLDAFHHTPRVVEAREALERRAAARLGDKVASVFEPNRGPRLKVDDPAFGVPLLSSSEVFRLDPVGEYSISKRRTPHLDKLLVSECDLLLPRSGQLGGVIGRAVLPLPTYYGHAASEHLVRVRCKSKEDAFFLWSVFASEPGYLATVGTAFGSSIPSLDCELIADMHVPWLNEEKRMELSKLVAASVEASTRAICAERKAVRIVEEAIEKGAN